MFHRRMAFPALVLGAALVLTRSAAEDTASTPARPVTLKGQDLPLSQVLAGLQKQTGIVVRDKRGVKHDSPLTLDLEGVPFWPALDRIARQAGAGVSVYQPDGSVALVEQAVKTPPLSYGGIFRHVLKRLNLSRDLETGVHTGVLSLEVAWEPWFKPLLLEVRTYEGQFAPDAGGKVQQIKHAGTGPQPVHGRTAVELDLPVPAPDRSSPALAQLKGTVAAVGPTRLWTVRFDDLAAAAAKNARPQQKVPEDGITVTLKRLTVKDTDLWEAEISLAYPADQPRFESFQQNLWLVYNEIYLEKGKGADRRRFVGRAEHFDELTSNRAVILYRFSEEGTTQRLGQPADWTLVYRTPGRFVELTGTFAFQNVQLP